jgi:hypothetical protein
MTEIKRVVRSASRRLFAIDLFRALAILLTVGLSLVLAARIVEKVFGLRLAFAPHWPMIFAGAGAGVLLGSLVWAFVARRQSLGVARELDARADLRESLSTAMCVERSQDPWAVAVVDTARHAAAKVRVREAIPLEAPKAWPAPIGVGLALLLVWMTLPDFDVLGTLKKQQLVQQQTQQLQAVKEDFNAKQKKLEELLKRANVDVKPGENDPQGIETQQKEVDPEALSRAMAKKLTDMTEKLQGLKESDSAAQVEAMKEAMRNLKTPPPGPLTDFSRQLARGDFSKAQESLEQINKQLAEGANTPEEVKQLQEQLKNMSEQLQKMGEDQQQVAKKLQEAGLDAKKAKDVAKQAASNPEAIKEAIEQMKNLSPEQMQQLMKMAQSACEACQNAGQMGESMQKMGEGMSQEGLQQAGMEGLDQLNQQLSQMEMMQSDMENLDAALKEAKDQLAQLGQCMGGGEGQQDGEGDGGMGQWRQGETKNSGKGTGGPGHGLGKSPEELASDYTTKKEKASTQTTKGPIIGSRLVYGQQVKGEAQAEFAAVAEAASKQASEAIEGNLVKRELQDAVKHYFGTLESKGKKGDPATPDTAKPDSAKPDAPKK